MENSGQSEHTIDLPNTGNHLSESSNDGFGMVTNSTRQDSVNGLSSRYLLPSSPEQIPVDFELMWRLRKYLVLLGVLAVTVTYNAGLTPPGGSWTLNTDGHDAGDPVLHVGYSLRYEVFFYCNTTAFAASLVLVILLLSKSVTKRNIWLRSMQLTMLLDLFSLLGAFAAGSCRAPKSSIYIWILVFAVFVYVVIHTLVSRKVIPKSLRKKLQRMMDEIRSRRGGSGSSTQASSNPEEDVEEDRKFILMLATFAATITYQAGLNPPGGFWAENPSYKHPPATSILRSNYLHRYNIFISCNATSFVASLVTIILLLSPELSSHGIRSKAVIVCVVFDLFGLIGAYAAGCCRSVRTSFFVVFITVIVWVCFAVLAAAFVYKPVADWLQKIKDHKCFKKLGRLFSLESGNSEQDHSHATVQHTTDLATVTPEEGSASKTENRVQNIKEDGILREHQHADSQQISNNEEAEPSSEQPSVNDPQPGNTTNIVFSPEDQCIDCQSVANDAVSDTGHPSIKCHQATNTVNQMPSTDNHSADNQQDANKKEQLSPNNGPKTANIVDYMPNKQVADTKGQSSSTDECKDAVIVVDDSSEQTTSDNHCNGATNDHPAQQVHSDGPMRTSEIEMVGSNNIVVPSENGNVDKKGGPTEDSSKKNSDDRPTSEPLKKSRTYLLLLAILAVSLTYQSGLNPPGGFWSRTENGHSAGDPILEDNHHPRYIAFFYLNAVAFVASFVMIIMLLNKRISEKATKRFALQIAMIVDLLALMGAYVMGSSREARNSMYISLLVGLVLAYVGIHLLIAHVIPEGWKKVVAEKLKLFLCKHLWPEPHQAVENQTGDVDGKEWERRRNLLLILAVLAATVTYQAGINPPGSVWSDDKKVSGTPGNPILQHNHSKRYDVFYYSNSVTFVSSVVIMILLVNKESCERGIKCYALRVCLVVGLVGLLIAYAAGSCRKAKESKYLIIIAVAVLAFLVIQVLVLSSTHNTVWGPLSKSLEDLLKRLLRPKESSQESASERQESSCHDEKEKRKRHKYLMLLAVLAASITYQAGLNPPGGFWYDDPNHVAGNPVLHDIHPWRYRAFFIFNGISFMTSIVVIMFLLKKAMRRNGVLLEVLHLIMILDLLALMTAFAAGICRKFRTSMYVYGLVIAVAVYLVVAIGVTSSIAKCLRLRKRNGGSLKGHPESASTTNPPIAGQQV
ncbi:hypothetical protein CFC21_108595 [Triticum aestivum]|uniref:PGG domain-containing protein n=2 Tax=Triticum aestivum TaxID=4565 RepID=A0A3B6TH95_WHEAT|nr:uncharacterized protein LOC123164760 [Triticum aestivum]XP_044438251.1 uncharacterized protein LOC123164760 [Triticum aestivum]XP_044438252.1 uncharacterized protein LOC123164760 [Triticum aestivum]KAF7108045.1 hypothetical protein CFC21_108595 [Triticum aestivum]